MLTDMLMHARLIGVQAAAAVAPNVVPTHQTPHAPADTLGTRLLRLLRLG